MITQRTEKERNNGELKKELLKLEGENLPNKEGGNCYQND